jgi:spore maturation protein CgeB
VEVIQFALDGRLEFANAFLKMVRKRNAKRGIDIPFGYEDVSYLASIGALEKALRAEVDWVILVAGGQFYPEALELLTKAGVKIASILTESPYQPDSENGIAYRSTVAFTNERTAVPGFAKFCPTYYWRHAYDPTRHYPGQPTPACPAHDVVFVGTAWEERIGLLEAVDWTGIDLGLYGMWDLLKRNSPLKPYIKGKITENAQVAALYRNAKIGLNLYRTSMAYGRNVEHYTGAESMNPRAYELAACGLFYLSDARAEARETFPFLPTFSNAAELEVLVHAWLAGDDDRRAIAAKLPAAVAGHTFDVRVRQMLDVLEKH